MQHQLGSKFRPGGLTLFFRCAGIGGSAPSGVGRHGLAYVRGLVSQQAESGFFVRTEATLLKIDVAANRDGFGFVAAGQRVGRRPCVNLHCLGRRANEIL